MISVRLCATAKPELTRSMNAQNVRLSITDKNKQTKNRKKLNRCKAFLCALLFIAVLGVALGVGIGLGLNSRAPGATFSEKLPSSICPDYDSKYREGDTLRIQGTLRVLISMGQSIKTRFIVDYGPKKNLYQ